MRGFSPKECAFGAQIAPAVAAQNSGVELFNNSTGPELLGVMEWLAAGPTGIQIQYSIQKGPIFTTLGVATPVLADDALPIGQIRYGSVTALPTANWYVGASAFQFPWWGRDYPFVVLQPSWSIVAYNVSAVNAACQVSFWWRRMWYWELKARPPNQGDF